MAQELQQKQTPGESEKSGLDNRRYKRRSVIWPAKMLVGKHELPCQIWNLSLGGARVRVDLPIQEGVEIILQLRDRGDIPATVVWAKGELLGVAFNVDTGVIKKLFEDRLHILGLGEED